MLQYITDENSPVSVIDQIKGVVAGGCRWVTVRMDKASDEEIGKVVEVAKPRLTDVNCFLLLHKRVDLAKTLNVGGVHLDKSGPLPSKARLELGAAAVIGVTANTIDDVKAVRSLDVDYITIGPLRESELFSEDLPILGFDKIKEIDDEMQKLEITIAHVAAGGVKKEDVVSLLSDGGTNGIAVCEAISRAKDIKGETEEFLKALAPFEKFKGED